MRSATGDGTTADASGPRGVGGHHARAAGGCFVPVTAERYEQALAEAQRLGLAERDPAADVEGHDTVAKVMILSALVFGRQLRPTQVHRQGITDIARSEIDRAAAAGARVKHVATLGAPDPDGNDDVVARVQRELVGPDDPLVNVEGTTNAVACTVSPIGVVTISGPGAGPQLAGQGVLSDVIAIARSCATDTR